MRLKKVAKIYAERIERIISQIPAPIDDRTRTINNTVVQQYQNLVDELARETKQDFARYKVPLSARYSGRSMHGAKFYTWDTVSVRTHMYDLVGYLKARYNTEKAGVIETLIDKLAELLGKITWQIVLTLLGIVGAVLTAYFLSRLGLRN